jgi:hypothetical protein
MGNLIQQAGDLLPKIIAFDNANENEALENSIVDEINQFEKSNRELKLATQTFRKLRESHVDLKKPSSLSDLNNSKKRVKEVSEELKPELAANEITRLLNKLKTTNNRKSIQLVLKRQFEDFVDVINKALDLEWKAYAQKVTDTIADIPGNREGQDLVKKLRAAQNFISLDSKIKIFLDQNVAPFSDSKLTEIIEVRQKWEEELDIWEENLPKYQEIIKQENPKIKKFFEDASTTGAPLSAFTPEVKERLTEGGSLDDYVIKKKSG